MGEKNCLWATWFKANNQGYAKAPSDFESARWNMEHTDRMNELVEKLERQDCQGFIENQNSFRFESPRSGRVISGKPDGRVVIYDVKTEQESASRTVQVQLYMYLVPRAQHDRWPGTTFEGAVVYSECREVRFPRTA